MRNVIDARLIAAAFITIITKVTHATLPIPISGISTTPIVSVVMDL